MSSDLKASKFQILDATALKIIAVVSMTIDHTGYVLFPHTMWLRCIGRLAFPLYAFLIVQGFLHTHDVRKYLARLGLLAVVSEIPFNLMVSGRIFYRYAQNVFFTLFLGLLTIAAMDWMIRRVPDKRYVLFWCVIPAAAGCLVAHLVASDYSYCGILMIALFYVASGNFWYQLVSVGFIQFWMGGLQIWAVSSFIPLAMYNGRKGCSNRIVQWLFYFYYPLHILVLYFLRILL